MSIHLEQTFALIQSEIAEIQGKIHFLSKEEKNPIRAIFENPVYSQTKGRFELLDTQIEQLDSQDPSCAEIRKIWRQIFPTLASISLRKLGQFQQALRQIDSYAHNPFVQPIPHWSPFAATDLVVFSEKYPGALPPNGVRESEFRKIEALYESIANDEMNLQVEGKPGARKLILTNIAKLLTRGISRELLFSLAAEKDKGPAIYLRAGSDSEASSNKDRTECQITLKLDRPSLISQTDPSVKQSEKMPQWIVLAHELIHVHHFLDGTSTDCTDHLVHRAYTDGEEQRTITGFYRNLDYDPINENTIRAEFGHHPRWGHVGGIKGNSPILEQFKTAIKHHCIDDIHALLIKKGDQIDLETIVASLKFAIGTKKTEAAEILYSALKNHRLFRRDSLPEILRMAAVTNFPFFQSLASRDGNIHAIDEQGRTCLPLLISEPEAVRLLLNLGADPDQKDASGKTPFDCVFQPSISLSKKIRLIREFIDAGVKEIPGSALFFAVKADHSALVGQILKKGVSLEIKDSVGNTPLLAAIKLGKLDLAQELIEKGADLSVVNKKGETALSMSFSHPIEFLRFIYSQLPAPLQTHAIGRKEVKTDFDPLQIASLTDAELRVVLFQSLETLTRNVKRVLHEFEKRNLSVNFLNEEGESPFLSAVRLFLPLATLDQLLTLGANINFQHVKTLSTPLHLAFGCRELEHAKFLMDRGGTPLLLNSEGKTALQLFTDSITDLDNPYYLNLLNELSKKNPNFVLELFRSFISGGSEEDVMSFGKFALINDYPELQALLFKPLLASSIEREFVNAIAELLKNAARIDRDLQQKILDSRNGEMIEALEARLEALEPAVHLPPEPVPVSLLIRPLRWMQGLASMLPTIRV